jgi:ferric enterobactin receptor
MTAVLLSLPGFSQVKPGAISGKVADSLSHQPVEYATVILMSAEGKTLNGAVTDPKGVFTIDAVQPGQYQVMAESMGYVSRVIKVTVDKRGVRLPDILLQKSGKTLNAFTVTAKAPLVENKLDKIVFNAANDISSQGGVATDVLKKVPMVSVDLDGNVELQGSSSVRFLINGKPSSVFGSSLADVLSSIPASQIKSIEAITSPGAKYDAQGTGGIINIILKDNKARGMNGSVSGSLGTRMENGAINLNFRNNSFGMNAFFSGNAQLRSHTPNQYFRNSSTTALVQDGYSEFTRSGYQTGIGFDWDINKKQSLTGTLGFDRYGFDGHGLTAQTLTTKSSNEVLASDRYSTNANYTRSFNWSLEYKIKLKKEGEELSMQYNDAYGLPNMRYQQYQTMKGAGAPFTGSLSDNPGKDRETEIRLDYIYPVSKGFELEAGLKTTFQQIGSAANVSLLDAATGNYAPDPQQSYDLHYRRGIYAAYVSGNFALGKVLDVKTGLRYERTESAIRFPGTKINPYNTWAPSVILSHPFKNGSTLKLAYNHRIERPDYGDLNPFVNLADPYNISSGNPELVPETGDRIELGFNKELPGGGNIYAALFGRFNSSTILSYTNFYPVYQVGDSIYENVSVATRANLGAENRVGLNVSASVPVTKKFNTRFDLFFSHMEFTNPLQQNRSVAGYDVRGNANLTYEWTPTFVTEYFLDYKGPAVGIQGRKAPFFTYTFAARKFVMNRKASIGLSARNPFNQYSKQVTFIEDGDYTSRNVRWQPYQSFGINFTYRFGKLEFKKQKEEDKSFLNPSTGG